MEISYPSLFYILYTKIKRTRNERRFGQGAPQIVTEYIKHQIKAGHVGLKVSKCGILVLQAEGFIGASPDGSVKDPSTADRHGGLEMKYIRTEY